MLTKHKPATIHSAVLLGVIAVLIAIAVAYTPNLAKGAADSLKCSTNSVTLATVGNQLSTQLLATSTNRAWARIQQRLDATGVATSTVYLALNGDVKATVNSGLALDATTSESTDHLDFGLNSALPYTGAVEGITSTGSTTVLITQCVY